MIEEHLVQVNVLRKWGPQARLNCQRLRGLVLGYIQESHCGKRAAPRRSPYHSLTACRSSTYRSPTVGKGLLLAAPPITRSPLVARKGSVLEASKCSEA